MKREKKRTKKIEDVNIDIKKLKNSIKKYQEVNDELMGLGEKGNSWLSTSNIVGEWAEILVCNSLSLTKKVAANEDVDAEDENHKTYQIKSRWHRRILKEQIKRSRTYKFGSVKKNENGDFSFDYLILVLFEDYLTENYKVYEIESKDIEELTKAGYFKNTDNKYSFYWPNEKKIDEKIKDITRKIKI